MTSRQHSTLLWFGVFGAPLAWTLQLVLGYGLEEAACARGSGGWGLDGDLWEVVVSCAAVGAALAAGGSAFAALRAVTANEDPSGRAGFMAFAGVLASALFLALILLTLAGVLALGSCRSG